MKIISHNESKQILRKLYKKEALERNAQRLREADPEERKIVMARIDDEVEERVRQQIITGH